MHTRNRRKLSPNEEKGGEKVHRPQQKLFDMVKKKKNQTETTIKENMMEILCRKRKQQFHIC